MSDVNNVPVPVTISATTAVHEPFRTKVVHVTMAVLVLLFLTPLVSFLGNYVGAKIIMLLGLM